MRPMNDNDPSGLNERELPEWLQAEQEAIREREAVGRLTIGLALLAVLVACLFALNAILAHAGYGA